MMTIASIAKTYIRFIAYRVIPWHNKLIYERFMFGGSDGRWQQEREAHVRVYIAHGQRA
ncbi:hypothetical protein HMPREF1583_01373 [Gardnerella vaginalis JCP8151B]|nr:hypothetical protein HMPREF1583_01373 [Gardnerella vaginalis JCP8151B]